MSYQLNMLDITDAISEHIESFYHAFHEMHLQPDPSSAMVKMTLPPRFGEGRFNVRKLGGTTFSSMSLCFNSDIHLAETVLDTGYFISINLGTDVSFGMGTPRRIVTFPSQTVFLGYTREGSKLHTSMSKDKYVRSLSFFLTEQQLTQYLTELDRLDMITTIETVENSTTIFKYVAITPRHHHLISKLAENPYKGTLEKLYFDSVAGELLIALIESLCGEKPTSISLADRDRELLVVARNLLLEDLHNPPTIAQLAKTVGMNEDKLKKGFKALFNNTIFKTLTEHRMRQAVKHVRANDMSIAEIAYDTGYENVSKFIAAFRKTYGVTPGMMRKEVKYSLPPG